VVGDKIDTLDTADKAALDPLDKQAGRNATVTGTLDGDTIEVSSVAAK
jgi:endonuclease YncB( thermonuclease family)